VSKKNWHEILGKSITADEWYIKYKNDIPRCKVCHNILSFVAIANQNRITHFRHPENSGCPSVESNGLRYSYLYPVERDESNAIELKQWVLDNGYYLYKQMCEILGASIRYQEFTEILHSANERDCWYYVGLTKEILPYTLLVNYGEFKKVKGRKGRELKIYLAFDSTITSYEQLWINPNSNSEYIFRIFPEDQEYQVIKIGDVKVENDVTPPSYFQHYLDNSNLTQ
jgi:hypothetical protein